MVGIMRPKDRESLDQIPQMLMGRGRFMAVEEIALPHWGEVDCPWCHELEAIKAFVSGGGELKGAIAQRYELLSDTERGLRGNEVLLPWEGAPIGGLSSSVFGDGNLAEMFLSVAASIQVLRDDGRLDERFRPPVARVLDTKHVFDHRFFEYRIQFLLLRACRPHDLNSRLVEANLIGLLATRLAGDNDPAAQNQGPIATEVREQRSELLLAAAQEKLPRGWLQRGGDYAKERKLIEGVLSEGEESIREFLRDAIERGPDPR
jgi:hypothetical protein